MRTGTALLVAEGDFGRFRTAEELFMGFPRPGAARGLQRAYQRFGVTVLAKEELAAAKNWKPSEHIPTDAETHRSPVRPPEVRPPGPPRWGA